MTVDDGLDADALAELVGQLTARGAPFSTYVLPTVRERTAADSVSPFPPTHVGNVGYRRILEPAADVLLRDLLPTAVESGARM